MCSTLAVKLKVTSGCAACSAARDAQRVRRPVQEIGIAEVDVARAGRDLRAHVVEHDVGGHGEEAATVHGRNRAVPAQVLAAARRLDVAGDAPLVRDREARVLARAPAGRARSGTSDGRRPGGRGASDGAPRAALERLRQRDQLRLAIGAEHAVAPRAASSARFSVA